MHRVVPFLVFAAPLLFAGQTPLTIERIFTDPWVEGELPKEVDWVSISGKLFFAKNACTHLYTRIAEHFERLFKRWAVENLGSGAFLASCRIERLRLDFATAPTGANLETACTSRLWGAATSDW